jgi:GDPmannose 4,6-dehydratase
LYIVNEDVHLASTFNTDRIDHIYQDPHIPDVKLYLHYGDLSVSGQMNDLIYNIQPDEIYHLGAQSHVRVSFDMPEYTGDVTGIGTVRLLEAIRKTGVKTRFYQASSSEMYGSAPPPQNEQTAFEPRSPYAAAKLYAYWLARNYREGYNFFICNGILFNHESPRRGETFVTRKITRAVARIRFGLQDKLYLGNLEARRDWGYAPEYVEAMWLILQRDRPDDFVIGTGESHSVREFCQLAFREAGIEIQWRGTGTSTVGLIKSIAADIPCLRVSVKPDLSGEVLMETNASLLRPSSKNFHTPYPQIGDEVVAVDRRYFRPTEVESLLADASKAREELGWEPRITFAELVRIMVAADLNALQELSQCQDVIRKLMNHGNKG